MGIKWEENEEEPYCFCSDEKDLETFAVEGGWENIADLEKSTGVMRDRFIGVWFFICHGRVYINKGEKQNEER